MQSLSTQLAERTTELAAAKKAQRRSDAHVQALIEQQRKTHLAMKQLAAASGGGGTEGAPADTDLTPGPGR